ncbi:unnamed protein product [Ceutorhynchus assimilis]|uniref:RZ-type domain-containing protein n=1 Tax=Ceutorhynchus assimilis TaxID=467358 RepID=A0A9N9MVK4_9CUCU|nr:unnamed protein product [Ceutorhynchus assimilis]
MTNLERDIERQSRALRLSLESSGIGRNGKQDQKRGPETTSRKTESGKVDPQPRLQQQNRGLHLAVTPKEGRSAQKNQGSGGLIRISQSLVNLHRLHQEQEPQRGRGSRRGRGRGSGGRGGSPHSLNTTRQGRGRGRGNERANDNRSNNGEFRSGHSSHGAYRQPRPERTMGFKYVERQVGNPSIQQVILDMSNDKNGFKKLIDANEMCEDMIVLVVKLVRNICGSTFDNNKLALLNLVLKSRFMEKLILYINGIVTQSPREKKFNRKFWEDPDEFWNALIKISTTVLEITPSYCDVIMKLLKTMMVYFPLIEDAHSIQILDSIKTQTENLYAIVEKKVNNVEMDKPNVRNNIPVDEDIEPPDDFRQIPIIPSPQEVVSDAFPFLRENKIIKAYNSVDQYLDIQFRLLREDFVAPLRRGICTHLRNQPKPKEDWKKLDDIKIYRRIRFISVETVNEFNCYKIRYDFSKQKRSFTYENSKKFMFGSLVCFTNDNFQSLLFGKIVQRDVKLLEQGLLIVGFHQDVEINFESDYLMVESRVYFEPYYQVLNVLQHMKPDTFPMEPYIIRVETGSRPPRYLLKPTDVNYTVELQSFKPLNFPPTRFYNLNDSQLSAFRGALTDEFSIIQGPPGTGKTYLGLKIAQTLLENKRVWYNRSPILVICYTNHALDQFLEGLLPITDEILRVGSRSKNEALKNFNLQSRRIGAYHNTAVQQKRWAVRDYMERLKTLSDILSDIDKNESILEVNCFFEVVKNLKNTWFGKAKSDDIKKWLLEGKKRRGNNQPARERDNLNQVQEGPASTENPEDIDQDEPEFEFLDDIFADITTKTRRPLLTLNQLNYKYEMLRKELISLPKYPKDLETVLHCEKLEWELWETETDLDYLTAQMARYNDVGQIRKPRDVDLINPFNMRSVDRWDLYYYWTSLYANHLRNQYQQSSIRFRTLYKEYTELRDIEDSELMTEHLVIGMTTTGAARLQSSLQALKSPIVIVEEAAEVLEAHIVAALTNHCQHLILIGDHLQLKPSAADYNIEVKYKLGISLFERMVINNIRCHTLNVQHRMRPEISKLVKPHIYPDLMDHESTLQRNPIAGIDRCLYFIDHQEPEDSCSDESKKNVHESKFIIALARHLILNDYESKQITILTPYLGQYFEMVREKKKPGNYQFLQDVRISVLDNYQGEESDIILLSLVRSNFEDKAGFLKIQNRVCVALSRARDGFYIIGNMNLLLKCGSENEIWEKIKAVLDEQNAIGTHLTLKCQVHLHRLTQVNTGEDFVKLSEGGCDLLCEAKISCGHICKSLCHVKDRDHKLYECIEKCNRLLCNNTSHVCKKLCYMNCGPCCYLVSRKLDCGHEVDIECHIDPTQYKCQVLVHTKLPCDHEAMKPCSEDPATFLCPFPCDTRVEPCGHPCKRNCHIRIDPDHLKYKCTKQCDKPRKGCQQSEDEKHMCNRFCYEDCEKCYVCVRKMKSCGHCYDIPCRDNVEDIICERRCNKKLPCDHPCKSKCFEDCGPCQVVVSKTIPDCNHTVKIQCWKKPERQLCHSQKCPRVLKCGHDCKRACKLTCTENCQEMVDCLIRAPCGHDVKKIMCHLRNTTDSKILLKYCTEPCKMELKCKTRNLPHLCSGTCGECMQGRIHRRCTEKCGVRLVCNHECPIPCRQACKPCSLPCRIRCTHSKCTKKCGEPCTPCKAPCNRKCEHVECRRFCGEICNVDPCKEKCPKSLKCGHPCVGFCGDPCPPLCRICDQEELTEITFGTEEDEDAIFVVLKDCNHVLESSGLETWLNQNDDMIGLKTCPKCTTTITSTERYSGYIKRSIQDISNAKQISFGLAKENEALKNKLSADLEELIKTNTSSNLMKECYALQFTIKTLLNRLKPAKNNRRQPINKIELNAITSKTQTIVGIIECFKDAKCSFNDKDESIQHVKILLEVLMRSEDHVTNQEVEDLEWEIQRLQRIVQFDDIQKSAQFRMASIRPDVTKLKDNIKEVLLGNKRYTSFLDEAIKKNLNELIQKVDCAVQISDKERLEIVQALNFRQGHWYKCPNGHPYVIDDCGGANQISTCICGEKIGGTNHHLLRSNALAGEMDGATRHAWPGGLY